MIKIPQNFSKSPACSLMMNKDRSKMSERILNLTLEIIYLLTGEEYVLVKKPGERVRHSSSPCVSEASCKTQGPSNVASPHSLIHKRKNDEKILELTHAIIRLLTGEEWEYLEGHRDLYKDVMMEDQESLSSVDGRSGRKCLKGYNTSFSSLDLGHVAKTSIKRNKKDYTPQIEIKLALCEEGNITDTDIYIPSDYVSTNVKEEPDSSEGGNLSDTEVYTIQEHSPIKYTNTQVKEEPCTSEGENHTKMDFYTPEKHTVSEYPESLIKEEVDTRNEGNLTPTEHTQTKYPYVCIKEVSVTGEEETLEDIYIPIDHTLAEYQSTPIKEEPDSWEEGNHPDTYYYITTHPKRSEYLLTEEGRNSSSGMLRVCNKVSVEQHKESSKNFNIVAASTFDKRLGATDGLYNSAGCQEFFITNTGLVKHQKPPKKKLLACPVCGKCYTRKSILVVHQRSHTGEKPFSCFECGKSFTDKSNLLTHQKIHTGENPFSCSECGRCFPYRSYLVKHQKIHATDKPFSCSLCGKRFTDSAGLAIHQRIHAVEKPFSCPQCGKAFVSKSNLVAHQKLHSGERQLSCLECGKCFTTRSNFLSHQRIHAGEKPFLCTDCGKYFTSKSNFLSHQKSHASEKPFSCPDCGKCFSHRSYVNKHQKIHQKGKNDVTF